MAEFSLITIEGKPLEKLIDVVSKGIGTIYRPRAIRKEAEAKAYKIEIIERAKSKALAEGMAINAETLTLIEERFIHKEVKRQANIDSITEIAAEQLSNETEVSEENVEEDWTTRFFNIVEDVSDAEMQKLWGRILAGEIKKPKSYSLRTLELLKNLNKSEAEVFMKLTSLVIISHNSPFIFRGEDNKFAEKYGLSFNDRLLLTELGLLQADTNITRNFLNQEKEYTILFEAGKYLFKVTKKIGTEDALLPIYRFSKIGEELLALTSVTINDDYAQAFGISLKTYALEVVYALITEKKDGLYHHTEPWIKL